MGESWFGSVAALLPPPFVYGPVGRGVGTDWRFTSVPGIRGTLYEIARSVARSISRYANPLARLAWRRAELIPAQNPETLSWLPRRHRGKAIVFPNVVVDRPSPRRTVPLDGHPATALYAGRLVPLKGLALVLRAVTLLPEWRLTICGHGPDEGRLKRLARRLRVDDRVRFHGGTDGRVSETIAALAAAMSEAAGTKSHSFPWMSSRTERLGGILAERFPLWTLPPAELTPSSRKT